jgi:hypothetical protein
VDLYVQLVIVRGSKISRIAKDTFLYSSPVHVFRNLAKGSAFENTEIFFVSVAINIGLHHQK